jgi:hypothetical protein
LLFIFALRKANNTLYIADNITPLKTISSITQTTKQNIYLEADKSLLLLSDSAVCISSLMRYIKADISFITG